MSAYRPAFISHAHADNELCDRYIAALRARGVVDIWYDRDNAQNGHLLGEQLQRELEARPAFVLLLTEHALTSFWVQLELQTYLGLMARDRARLLLPVRIGRCEVPAILNAFLWVDALAQPSFDRAIDEIAKALMAPAANVTPPPPWVAPLPPRGALPPLGPAPAAERASPALHLTPMPLYNLGFRGYAIGGVECVLPPICPVPGSIFTMGSDKARDKAADDDETPQYPVQVGDFALGQYPVTVAEYACAVRAKAVREPPEGWIPGGKLDWKTQLTRPDHPVTCVSWQDVLAYTRWLAKLTGQGWRLPTEAEWEKAARWDAAHNHGRIYPWGDQWDNTRANTNDGGPGTTTPVGAYADRGDASPYGAHDLAGNVWEWTSTLYQRYPYSHDSKHEAPNSTGNRVPRGGSWDNYPRDCRAAYRDNGLDRPVNVNYNIGVRVVLAAPGS